MKRLLTLSVIAVLFGTALGRVGSAAYLVTNARYHRAIVTSHAVWGTSAQLGGSHGTEAVVTATCPTGTHPTGGGFGGTNETVWQSSGTPTGWYVLAALTPGASAGYVQGWVTCQ